MRSYNVFIEKNDLYFQEVAYTLELLGQNKGVVFTIAEQPAPGMITIGSSADATVPVSALFFQRLRDGVFAHSDFFEKEALYIGNGRPDYLATIFYMVNCLQEYAKEGYDSLGRFKFAGSYQEKFGVVQENLVQRYMDGLFTQLTGENARRDLQRSRVFISHDIDDVYGSWKEDLFFAVKKGQLGDLARILVSIVLQRPSWLNFDQVMNVCDEFGFKSLFLFIVHKGKSAQGLRNADYSIDSPKIRRGMEQIRQRGFEIGLHKSISPVSFRKELALLKEPVIANRYHYLRFRWPSLIGELEESGLTLDCSLGFAEEYGFRNCYARPFVPYNLQERRRSTFVEVPLQVMDRTFYGYRKDEPAKAADHIIRFFEKHREDAVLSLLWHNNFYSDVKFDGYLAALKKVLGYLHDEKITSVSARELREIYLPS